MHKSILNPALIKLPSSEHMEYWPVIACDQFTSEEKYWQEVEKIVRDNPSTLNIIFPEVYLEKNNSEKRIENIHKKMEEYSETILNKEINGYMYVERTLQNGKIRQGIVGKIDLEEYSYEEGATCKILPSENTILYRIPPRLAVRRNAKLESPHILMLIDDEDFMVIEPLKNQKQNMEHMYEQELLLNGGKISGWAITNSEIIKQIKRNFIKLENEEKFKEKYKTNHPSFVMIAGDGNHSLATAKAYWEELKGSLSEEEAKNHPARYCLVEVENIQNKAIEIEPIHRVVFNMQENDFFNELNIFFNIEKNQNVKEYYEIQCVWKSQNKKIKIPKKNYAIETAAVDDFIQEIIKKYKKITIDYVHGENAVLGLAKQGQIGIILSPMQKSDLFKGVANGGVLPKKTFSMGHANEKRYYIECRNIK